MDRNTALTVLSYVSAAFAFTFLGLIIWGVAVH